jgi:hypothetical protein
MPDGDVSAGKQQDDRKEGDQPPRRSQGATRCLQA